MKIKEQFDWLEKYMDYYTDFICGVPRYKEYRDKGLKPLDFNTWLFHQLVPMEEWCALCWYPHTWKAKYFKTEW